MRARHRGRLAAPTVLVVVAAVEAVCVRANVLGTALIGIAAVLALIVVLARADLTRIGLGAALACAFTISWNGWYVGPVRPGDVLAPLTLICFAIARPDNATRTPPWWVKQLVVALVVITLLATVAPVDLAYLSHRVVLDAGGMPITAKPSITGGDVGVALKFVIAVVIAPMAFVAAALVDRRSVHRLAIAYVTGTALSGFAATVDHFHIGNIGELVTGVPNAIDRQAGFTTQPNFLAASLVLAIPFACWALASTSRRNPLLGTGCLVFLLTGVYASGSRGGAVCAVLAVVVSLALLPRSRASTPAVVLVGLAVAGVVAAALPSLGRDVLRVTRLSGNATTAGSDTVRGLVGAQGVRDFKHSPVWGIGLHVSTDASQVYLQELASGGLILFAAMLAYNLAALWTSWRLIGHDDLAAAIAAAVVSTLALNFVEADLTDRFYYIPEAILIALMVVVPRAGGQPDQDAASALDVRVPPARAARAVR